MSGDRWGHVSRLVVACALERPDRLEELALEDLAPGPVRRLAAIMAARRSAGLAVDPSALRDLPEVAQAGARPVDLLEEAVHWQESFAGYVAEARRLAAIDGLRRATEAAEGPDPALVHALADRLNGAHPAVEAPVLSLVGAEAFAAVEEASAEALLGDDENTVLSAGGMMMLRGKGGGGKTTLEVDLVVHLAAGVPWLGLPVPRRCRVLVIENEGPRGKFRRKLRAKLAAWTGPAIDGYLFVLEEPWARFSFAGEALREQLAAFIREHAIDVLAAGPVGRLGIAGGGTPEEVATFVGLVEQLRAGLERPLAALFVHHDNKLGTVSGAWEGVPDTCAHVRAQGNGATRVEWEKCRWASALHGTAWKLLWRAGEGFAVDETPEVTDEDVRAGVLAAVEASPGCSANALEKAVAHNATRVREARDALLDADALVNLGGGKGGIGGGGMRLYLPSDAPFVQGRTNAPAEGGTVRPSLGTHLFDDEALAGAGDAHEGAEGGEGGEKPMGKPSGAFVRGLDERSDERSANPGRDRSSVRPPRKGGTTEDERTEVERSPAEDDLERWQELAGGGAS